MDSDTIFLFPMPKLPTDTQNSKEKLLNQFEGNSNPLNEIIEPLENGLTIEQVREILGKDSELQSDQEISQIKISFEILAHIALASFRHKLQVDANKEETDNG